MRTAWGLAARLRTELVLLQRDSVVVSLPFSDVADKLTGAGIRASVLAG